MRETVHIYHTNDLHSHFENWPKITKYITEKRAFHKELNEEMLLIDLGDHVDRFHPISEASYGKLNVQLLNNLQYNYATIGNNEGITLSYDQLDRLYEDAHFKVLVGNLYNKSGELPNWALPYDIHVLPSGTRIGIIGLTIHYISLYQLLGWNMKEPYSILKAAIEHLRSNVDALVLLSHLGINEDEKIADEFPEIDIILGAHTHHLLENGKRINNSLLCCAQKYGNYIGHVKLEFDISSKLISSTANVVSTIDLTDCEKTKHLISEYTEQSIQSLMNDKVAEIEEDLYVDWYKDSNFVEILATAIKEWCNGDISMVNSGLLLETLPKGIITKADLHRVCPHPINPCKVKLRGDVLKEIILHANTEKMEKHEIIGLGFRGKVMGKMIYDGVHIETKELSDGKRHVNKILINGDDLNPEQIYNVATVDMFTFGSLFPQIREAADKEYYMPELLRDILAYRLGRDFPIKTR